MAEEEAPVPAPAEETPAAAETPAPAPAEETPAPAPAPAEEEEDPALKEDFDVVVLGTGNLYRPLYLLHPTHTARGGGPVSTRHPYG